MQADIGALPAGEEQTRPLQGRGAIADSDPDDPRPAILLVLFRDGFESTRGTRHPPPTVRFSVTDPIRLTSGLDVTSPFPA